MAFGMLAHNDVADLENFAREVAASGQTHWIELVDLSALAAGHEQGLVDAVADILRQYISRSIQHFFRLDGSRLIIVSDARHGHDLDSGLRALSEDLMRRHDGQISTSHFRLPDDIETFLEFCGEEVRRSLTDNGSGTGGRAVRTGGRRLSEAVRAAHALLYTDLSASVHEVPVIGLADGPDADGSYPVVATELQASRHEIARAVGLRIDRDPWLERHVAGLIDGCILRQVRAETWRLRTRLYLDVLPETVLCRGFELFAAEISPQDLANLTLELPAETRTRDPESYQRACKAIWDAGACVGLDQLAPERLESVDGHLSGVVSVKLTGGAETLRRHDPALRAALGRHPDVTWILLDAADEATADAAARAGFDAVQPPGVG